MLGKEFFERDTLWVAKNLLGKRLIRIYRSKRIEGIITETEAYRGFDDRASHASRGKTSRTSVMFGDAGTIYVYLIYGMYYCLNIVTERKEYPAAVLIRGIKSGGKNINGPGRVCKYFKIDKNLNKKLLSKKTGLWIEKGIKIVPKDIILSHRIGVDYAGPVWSKKLLRFYVKND